MSREKIALRVFPPGPSLDTNRAVQAQKMARGWKFRIHKVEELYYPCSENKGADQLSIYLPKLVLLSSAVVKLLICCYRCIVLA